MTNINEQQQLKERVLKAAKEEAKTEIKLEFLNNLSNACSKYKLSFNQLNFLIFTYQVDTESIYKMVNNGFKNSEVNEMFGTWTLNKVKGKEIPDLINLTDEAIDLIEDLIGGSSKEYVGLYDDFSEVYPAKSSAGFNIRNTPNRRETEKNYLNAIKAEALRKNVSVLDYHNKVIEAMKLNRNEIQMGIGKCIENRAWDDFMFKSNDVSKINNSKIG